jgi:hypothetical protein
MAIGLAGLAGFGFGLNESARVAYEENQIKRLKQEMDFTRFMQEQVNDQQAQQKQAERDQDLYYGWQSQGGAPQVSAPPSTPQPPPPGTPSQPMAMPHGFGGPTPPMQTPGANMARQPTPQGVTGMGPQGPLGWHASPSAKPELGGAPPGAANAPAASPSVSARPRVEDTIPPKMMYQSSADLAGYLMKSHPEMPLSEVGRIVRNAQPLMDRHNKEVLAQIDLEDHKSKAARDASLAAEEDYKAKHPEVFQKKSSPLIQAAERLQSLEDSGQGQSTEAQALRASLAKQGRYRGEPAPKGLGGTGFGTPTSPEDIASATNPKGMAAMFAMGRGESPLQKFNSTPIDKLTDKDVAAAREEYKLRGLAWDYINNKRLPYKKSTGKQDDRNKPILDMVAQIGMELHMAPEELALQSSTFKADAASLAFQTKKLDAIEAQTKSFHYNISTFKALAEGKVPETGSESLRAMAGKLHAIDFSSVKSFNDVKLKIQQEFSDPTVAAYMTAAMSVSMDYARIMQGPQSVASLTVYAMSKADDLIAKSYDKDARDAVIGSLETDTVQQVQGIKDQLGEIHGRLRHGYGRPEEKAAGGADSTYAEIRTTEDGRKLGKRRDNGAIEEIQ